MSRLTRRIGDVERQLADGRAFLLGDRFTVADAYLTVVLGWMDVTGVDPTPWPATQAYLARMRQRPAVRKAFLAEGLAA